MNSNSQNIEEQIDEPMMFNAWNTEGKKISREQRLNSIFQMCLEPHVLGDYLSLTSPRNFVVQYFTLSQNHPVKSCCKSQCPLVGNGLRTPDGRQQGNCSELSRCKRSGIARGDQFSHCANSPNEAENAVADLPACSIPSKKADGLHPDHGLPCSSSTSSSGSCCTSKTFDIPSVRVKKKDTRQQTDPEPSWQARCSNFIINLPVTLSDKLFGPRTTCEAFKDCKRTICNDDSKINRGQPIPKITSEPSSRDQGNKKLVQSVVSSLTDRSCHKNVGTERVFLERANRVDPCYSRTSQSFREDVSCERPLFKSEKSSITCKKVIPKCGKCREDDFARLEMSTNYSDSIHSRRSEPPKAQFNTGARSNTRSSISEGNKRGNASPRFSNWPAIISEKFFGSRNERDREKTRSVVKESAGIVSAVESPSAAKKGRLSLKKYTISQTPEATEETLSFDILTGKQLTETRSKLQSEVCVEMISAGNQQKLETIQERNEILSKCLGTGGSLTSKRCVKSRRRVVKTSSRKAQQLEKKTSTEHIFLSSLIMKLLNKHKDGRSARNETKCYRNIARGRDGNAKNEHERKSASRQRSNTISRKYATTSIYKHRNECPRHIEMDSRKNGTDPICSFEQDVSQDYCTLDPPDVTGKSQTRSDFPIGKKEIPDQGNTQANRSRNNCENVKDSCEKLTEVMSLQSSSSNEEERQGRDSLRSSKVRRLVESGVLQVIDKSCRRESRELCCIALHRRKREVKSAVREKCCNRISSQKKFTCRVRRGNEIKDATVPEGDLKNSGAPGEPEETSNPGRYRKNDLVRTRMESRPKRRCHEKLPMAKVCKRIIVTEDRIPNSTKGQNRQYLVEGTRKAIVTAGENICEKMLHDRETSTDDLSGSTHCQNSKCPEEGPRKNRELRCTNASLDANIENVENCSPSNQRTENNTIANASQGLSQDPVGSHPRSSTLEGLPREQNDNSSVQRQSNNGVRIRVNREECVRSPREDDACWVCPEGISEGEDTPEAEQDGEKVFSELRQEDRRERGNTICGSKTCLYRTLIKSETKEAPRTLNENDSCQRESIAGQSSSNVDNCSPPLPAAEVCSPEGRRDSTNEPADKHEGTNDDQQLSDVHLKIESPEKQSSWIKSPGRDLTVTKPESRNIINSYYSQRRNVVASRREARNDERAKVKKGKAVQRDGSTSEKSVTKARKPFQRIENVRQVGCAANVVIRDDKGKRREASENENGIVNKKTKYNENASVLDNEAKDYLVQNVAIDTPSFPKGSIAISTNDHVSSIGELKKMDSTNPAKQIPASKIPQRPSSRLSTKSKTPNRVLAATIKTPGISDAKLIAKQSARKSCLKKENGVTASRKTYAKEIGETAESAESEFPNRLTRSIDTCHGKDVGGWKELKTHVYMLDKEDATARTLQIEMSRVEDQKIPNPDIGKGTGWIAKRRESSNKSSKSASLQKQGEEKESERSGNVAAAEKRTRENKQRKGNQSKSETASEKKNDNDKESTPLKILSQIDSEVDSRNSTQGRVTINADLFTGALIDEKNNIKGRDLLQSADEENFHSDRISASENEGLRKSDKAEVQSKSKVSKPSESSKTTARKTSGKKFRNFEESSSTSTDPVTNTGENRTEILSRKSPAEVDVNSSEEVAGNSGLNWILKPDQKTRRGANRDFSTPGSPPQSSHEDKNASEPNRAGESSKNLENMEKRRNRCSVKREDKENRKADAITEVRGFLPPQVKCEKSTESECKGRESKGLCKGFQEPINEEKEEIAQGNNISDKITTFCTSGRVISDSSDRNFSFTDDLKRFLDQGQEFFTSKRGRNGNQTNLSSDDKQEPASHDSAKSNKNGARYETSEFCKSVDYEKLTTSSKICDEDQASNNSILSIQKAYTTLKSILNKRKNAQKGFLNANQTKETQICTPVLDESSIPIKDCVTCRKNVKSPESGISKGNESPTVSVSFGSSIFSNPSSPACNKKDKEL